MSQKYILGRHAQTRKQSVRYVVVISLLLLLLSVIQLSFFGRFRIFGAIPDLMIAAVLCIGFFTGPYTGAVSGIGAGFLIDALGTSGISVLPLCYLLAGYLTGYYARKESQKGLVQYLIFLAVTLVYRAVITVLYAWIVLGSSNFAALLLGAVLPELFGTALAGLALYFPMRLLCGWLEKKA
ncbi:MAG: rod shape-determining protein MreD [Clostridia bacterium]|nr:rod shape-determining protein MreD [Clostridia bacterium]